MAGIVPTHFYQSSDFVQPENPYLTRNLQPISQSNNDTVNVYIIFVYIILLYLEGRIYLDAS